MRGRWTCTVLDLGCSFPEVIKLTQIALNGRGSKEEKEKNRFEA